jgi:hypothetical protein
MQNFFFVLEIVKEQIIKTFILVSFNLQKQAETCWSLQWR